MLEATDLAWGNHHMLGTYRTNPQEKAHGVLSKGLHTRRGVELVIDVMHLKHRARL